MKCIKVFTVLTLILETNPLLCISYVILYNFEDTKLIRGHIASVALIGVWTNLTVLMGKIPAAGIYIIMIANVAKGINIRLVYFLG